MIIKYVSCDGFDDSGEPVAVVEEEIVEIHIEKGGLASCENHTLCCTRRDASEFYFFDIEENLDRIIEIRAK